MAHASTASSGSSSKALFGVLQHCLRGSTVVLADHGVLAFRVIGLVEETWAVHIDAEGVRVAPGTPEARATVFCTQAQLEALLTNQPPQEPLRISGDRRYFERVSELSSTAQDIVSVRSGPREAPS